MTNSFFAAMVVMDSLTNHWVTLGQAQNSIGQLALYQQGYFMTQVVHQAQWDESRIRVTWSTNVLGPKDRTRWATPADQEITLESFMNVPGMPPYADPGIITPQYYGRTSQWSTWTNNPPTTQSSATSKGPPLPPGLEKP